MAKKLIAKYDFKTGMLIAMEVAKKVQGLGFYPYPVWQGVKEGKTTTLKAHKMPNINVNNYDEIIYTPESLISTKWKFELHVEESQVVEMEKIEIEDKKPEIQYIPDSDDEIESVKNELVDLVAEEKEAAAKKAAEEKAAEEKAAADKKAAEERAAAKKKRAEEKEAEEKRKAEEEEAKRQEKILLIEKQYNAILEHEKYIKNAFDCILDKKEYIDSLAEKVFEHWGPKKINASHVWVSTKDTKETFEYIKAGAPRDGAIMTDFMTTDISLFPLYQHVAQKHNLREDVMKNIETNNGKRKKSDDDEKVQPKKQKLEKKKKRHGKAPRKALAKSSASGGSHEDVGGTVAKSTRKEMPDSIKTMMQNVANEEDSSSDDEETTDSEE